MTKTCLAIAKKIDEVIVGESANDANVKARLQIVLEGLPTSKLGEYYSGIKDYFGALLVQPALDTDDDCFNDGLVFFYPDSFDEERPMLRQVVKMASAELLTRKAPANTKVKKK